ncbi:hypothetical protein [Bdellovibrio bacteriovorus]|uniref:Secreted protein n=1 Tax=Bdellovibrio bacteriovorus str. Tiberius TaxID=1069642 RepID=K7YWD9_BDEBC|nr:hypothetical protein [Bdellovibrio bacteriovorus]AFY01025.1 hypothetical protein Bdt_1327 [Bdellovibrio bacteriovorus str. Tiberius]
MKQFLSSIAMISMISMTTLTAYAEEGRQVSVGSVFTNLSTECVEISAATEQSPIDFYDAECKGFGGYQLNIAGGDLRYHPELAYGGQQIALNNPYSFHDLASPKVEWMYRKTNSLEDGSGSLQWIGFIYRLSEATEDGTSDVEVVYAVRLDGADTCSIGTASTEEQARALVLSSKARCK